MKRFFYFRKWQMPLIIVFFIFGYLLAAQYETNTALNNSLASQSLADLGTLVVDLNDKKDSTQEELLQAQKDLAAIQEKTSLGLSLSATMENQIKTLKLLTGAQATEGPGITVNITGDSNLMYYDLIDLVNELFATGAESVAINDTRIKTNTVISEAQNAQQEMVITLDGKELLSPIIIKAIGDGATLEKGLTYPGGIINNLNIFYQVYPVIKIEPFIKIPAAVQPDFQFVKSYKDTSTTT